MIQELGFCGMGKSMVMRKSGGLSGLPLFLMVDQPWIKMAALFLGGQEDIPPASTGGDPERIVGWAGNAGGPQPGEGESPEPQVERKGPPPGPASRERRAGARRRAGAAPPETTSLQRSTGSAPPDMT